MRGRRRAAPRAQAAPSPPAGPMNEVCVPGAGLLGAAAGGGIEGERATKLRTAGQAPAQAGARRASLAKRRTGSRSPGQRRQPCRCCRSDGASPGPRSRSAVARCGRPAWPRRAPRRCPAGAALRGPEGRGRRRRRLVREGGGAGLAPGALPRTRRPSAGSWRTRARAGPRPASWARPVDLRPGRGLDPRAGVDGEAPAPGCGRALGAPRRTALATPGELPGPSPGASEAMLRLRPKRPRRWRRRAECTRDLVQAPEHRRDRRRQGRKRSPDDRCEPPRRAGAPCRRAQRPQQHTGRKGRAAAGPNCECFAS